MFLLKGEIDTLYAYDRAYKIITNARHWIALSENLETANGTDRALLLLNSTQDVDIMKEPREYQSRLLERIVWFYTCEYDKCNNYKVKRKRNDNILYRFDIDSGRIFSAFYKTYGIDIEKELDTMHWWKFMALFNDLESESNFKGIYMYYRGYDRFSKEYTDAIPEMKTQIDKQIRSVLIDDGTEDTQPIESPIDKLIREARERKQL